MRLLTDLNKTHDSPLATCMNYSCIWGMTMVGRSAKLNALRHLAMTLGEGTLIPLLSFFAGRLDRVHFVRNREGANVWVHLSGNVRLWPRTPFRGEIDGAAVQNPITFIDIAALRDDDVFVTVDLAAHHEPDWFTAVLYDEAEDPKERLRASADAIRAQTDLALDAYRVAGEQLAVSDEEDRSYLTFVLEQAKKDMRSLNAELARLEAELTQVSDD